MTHEKKRCKYCGKVYYYQASGNGCFEPTNDDTYCPRCKEIINKALETEVLKDDIINHVPKEVDKFSDELLDRMKKLKEEYFNKKNIFKTTVNVNLNYKNIDVYYIDNKKYYIAWDKVSDKHYYQDYEYNSKLMSFFKPYEYFGRKNVDCYLQGCNVINNFVKLLSNNKFKEFKLLPPSAELYFFDTFGSDF